MKVLFAVPYLYDPQHDEFCKTSSGYGYMVKDIIDEVSANDDVYVFTHQFTSGYKEKFNVIKHTKNDVLKALRFKDICTGIEDAVKNSEGINTRLHYLYYQLNKGAFVKVIKGLKPDLVHIHGLTYQTKPFVEVCTEMQCKYMVTLHGLNGISESVILPNVEKKYEMEALKELNKNRIPVTVISTGIKKKIEKIYSIDTSNIRIVLNGTRCQPSELRYITGRAKEKYEIVCVGSISYRKNQTKLVDCLSCMDEPYKKKLHVTFCGVDSDNISLDKYIEKYNLQNIAEYRGFVPREQMSSIWEKADLNIVMSKEEGFGLSMIEGFMHGIPTITFSDLDAVEDVYNEDAVELFNSRTCKDINQGIIRCMEREFDSKKIIEWGKHFSIRSVGDYYSEIYKAVCLRNSI